MHNSEQGFVRHYEKFGNPQLEPISYVKSGGRIVELRGFVISLDVLNAMRHSDNLKNDTEQKSTDQEPKK